jgi:hypothetical protein
VVLFILAVLWGVYLAQWVRSRRDRRGVNSISSFSKHLSVLERTSPARPSPYAFGARVPAGRPTPIFPAANYLPPRPAMSLSAARRRRRNVLYALAGSVVATLVLIPFGGSLLLMLHVLCDLMLVAYLGLLVRTQRLAVERRSKVRYLPGVGVAPEPQFLLQRSAN